MNKAETIEAVRKLAVESEQVSHLFRKLFDGRWYNKLDLLARLTPEELEKARQLLQFAKPLLATASKALQPLHAFMLEGAEVLVDTSQPEQRYFIDDDDDEEGLDETYIDPDFADEEEDEFCDPDDD